MIAPSGTPRPLSEVIYSWHRNGDRPDEWILKEWSDRAEMLERDLAEANARLAFFSESQSEYIDVTHWMPLPGAPK